MPVDYINIIDRVWGHLKLGSSGKCIAEDRHFLCLDRGVTASLGEGESGRDAWAQPGVNTKINTTAWNKTEE